MPAIITQGTRILNSEQLIASFSDTSADKQYLFIGKSTPWEDDTVPPTPVDSFKSDVADRRSILSMQRITEADVSLGILRRDWTTGRYYDFYRHDYGENGVTGVNLLDGTPTIPSALSEANYYVMTDEFNVYMCIWNNKNAASTVKPTGKSTSIITTADGYQWKYMYTVAPADALKFASTNFIPVRRIDSNPGTSSPYYTQWEVRAAAVPGTINRIMVNSGGTGYAASTTFPITVIGDGTGCTATASTNSSGSISSVTVTNIGTGYTWASVSIPGGSASVTPIISPRGGYGYDPVTQLNANYSLIGVQLPTTSNTDFPSSNEYRVVGIMRSPKNYGTTTTSTAATLNANRLLNISLGASGTFLSDETVVGSTSGATATVVSYGDSKVRIVQIGTQKGTFSVGETITGSSSGAMGIVSTITQPEVDINTGDIVYLEHRRPVNRQPDQIEVVKVIVAS
jgi:hypothetical protein